MRGRLPLEGNDIPRSLFDFKPFSPEPREPPEISLDSSGRRHRRPIIPALPFCRLKKKAAKPKEESYPEDPQTLGEHLLRRRIDRGLLQREVALELGVSTSAYRNWEAGRTDPKLRYLPAVQRFLGFCPFDSAWGFGQRLRAAREARGLSRRRAALLLGIDPGTIRDAEASRRQLAVRSEQAVRELFGEAL